MSLGAYGSRRDSPHGCADHRPQPWLASLFVGVVDDEVEMDPRVRVGRCLGALHVVDAHHDGSES